MFYHITKISTTNRIATVTTAAQTSDGEYAIFQISIIYKIKSQDAGLFYKVTGTTVISDKQMSSIIKTNIQACTITYNIFDLMSESLDIARVEFQQSLSDMLYSKYYVTLISVSFDDVDAGETIETILQKKAEADQQIEIAEKEAAANMITAQNDAAITEVLADAQAYAVTVSGVATADAAAAYTDEILTMIDTLYASSAGLTYNQSADIILSIVFYKSWDGQLPSTLTSDSLSSMIGALIASSGE